jgi:methyl-accepting chemotaxis protein
MDDNTAKIERRAIALFHQSPFATTLWSPNLKIVDVNKAFLELSGYSRDRVLNAGPKDFKVISASGDGFQEARTERRNGKGEMVFDFPTGIKTVVRLTVPLMDQDGELENFFTIYQDVTEDRKNLEEIRAGQVRSEKIKKYMDNEVDGFIGACSQAASGDLTVRLEIAKPDNETKETHDQMVRLRDGIRGMIVSIRENVGAVNAKMVALISTSNNAGQCIEDASKGVQQIAVNTGQVSDNTSRIAEGFEQINKAVQDMSAAVEEITSSMESVSHLSRETDELARKGAGLAGNADKSMGEIADTSEKVYVIVQDVEKQMGEITKIVGIIRDLANQTNLLALNAAIEAARAGEAGRGFAVVATEVKSLAQESRSSTEKIEEMITALQKGTRNATSAMGESKAVIEQGEKMVAETVTAFNNIASAIDKVAKSAGEVAAATQEQAATTEQVTANITELAGFVDRTAQEASDAAAATEESSAALEEITRMVQSVSSVALEVTEANRKFRVD